MDVGEREGRVDRFQTEREELNALVMRYAGLTTQRFFSLDSKAYREGALAPKIKELLGLVASLVLRCDDCVTYHLIRCCDEGVGTDELNEALAIGLVVGGSITIPHLRRAYRIWDELQTGSSPDGDGDADSTLVGGEHGS